MFPMGFSQQAKQSQQLLLTLAMQQAFVVLQMPILELSEWLETQIEQNPVLERKNTEDSQEGEECASEEEPSYSKDFEPEEEISDDTFAQKHQDSPFAYRTTLFEHLMHQAEQTFVEKEDLCLAKLLIGDLDERGFLTTSLNLLSPETKSEKLLHVLQTIQQFDPPGIAARSLQETLLIQLKLQNKEHLLCYKVIDKYFEDLLELRFGVLAKKCKCSSEELKKMLKDEISLLNPYPGSRFQSEPSHPLIPDIIIQKEGEKWKIEINDSHLPRFKLSAFYQSLLPSLDDKEQSYFRKQFASARWLARIIRRRNQTLLGITKYILKKQASFFEKENNALIPMAMQEIAEVLDVHESTIARAVSHKYLSCPLGIFALRSFFTGSLNKESKEVSTDTAKKMLQKVITQENKKRPLSDRDLLLKLNDLGFKCARRTITKYRKALRIAPSYKRKVK